MVESTTADYFVLYVRHELDADTSFEIPVLVKRGEAGTTTLAENVEALHKEHYLVEKFLISDPADVDGDCIDDITELADPVGMNPVNPAAAINLTDGAVGVPDRGTFEALAYYELYLKFVLIDLDTSFPSVYFVNTTTHDHHSHFLRAIGVQRNQEMVVGSLFYVEELDAPDGSRGLYSYRLPTSYFPISLVERSYTVLAASMPLLSDNLAFNLRNTILSSFRADLPLYSESRVNLVFDIEIYADTGFLALNTGEGYGLLRAIGPDERPHHRDIVIYGALPNDLPRVAGIVSTVPQTPLSHVNLRAIQDRVPNAYIRDALDEDSIDDLIGSYVHYKVTEDGWEMRAATRAEVDAHHAASRPAHEQTPQRDLSITSITPLSEIGFGNWTAFGVKAANVAVLGTLGFPNGTVPDGFAVPFYFYDEFMKHNGFYDDIEEMLADPDFQANYTVQESELKGLRKAIKDAETPGWITAELEEMHGEFPNGTSLRYRSSTNNEDLPGFNGAGLYDSKTQHPEETEEDGISKSLKQVYASLWNFRAFAERDFYRINHTAAAMGVLVHPNYSDELANGVAVSFDPIYYGDGSYYVNTQLGEDLVTNPDAHSIPEEILLNPSGSYAVLATSNQVPLGQLLMSDDQLAQLGRHLTVIHEEFRELYNPGSDEPFAMEIEFKITSDNILAIKQARPWVFSTTPADTTAPTLASIERHSPADQNTDSQTLVYRVTFSENVTGVDQADFALSLGSTGISSASGQFAQTRSPALAITQANTISDTITVPDSGTATSVSVAIDISHTYIGDLKVDLIAPDGTAKTLHNRAGGTTDDIDQTYAPDFAGVSIAGTWTLRINDNYAAADDGTLNSWTLTINHGAGTASPVTAVSGSGDTYQVTVSATTDGTYNLDLVSSGHGITDESSNPLADTVPTTGTDETYTVSTTPADTTAPTVSSIERHNPTPESTDSQTLIYEVKFSEDVTGVDVTDFALSPGSTGGTGSGQFAQTRSPALAITQASTISDTITVPDSGTATSVSVAIDISHTWIGDLKVDLVAPDGTTQTLHDRSGGDADDIDQTYAPDFAGVPIAGTWTLRINDNYAAADDGTLNSWTLTINHGAGTASPVTAVSGSGDTYQVTVSATTDGTYNLDLVSSGHGITDESSNPLADTVPTTGTDETYTVSTTPADTTAPTVSSIERYSPADQNTDSQTLVYQVTFSENVTGVDSADFALSPDSTGAGSMAGLTGSGDTYRVTVSAAQDGTYNLDLVSSGHGITDESSNPLADTVPTTGTDETYTVSTTPADTTPPTVSSIERFSPTSQNTTSQTLAYRVTFSENVTGVDAADFSLSSDSTGGGTSTSGQFAQTRSPALAITEDNTVSDTITVPDSGTATSVSVAIDISHTWIGDLKVDLVAPDGTTQTLHDRSGGDADDIDQTYAPDFAGVPIAGTWTLRINDNYAAADDGTLNSWTLTINHGAGTASPVTAVSGSGDTYQVTVSATTDGTYNLDLVSSGHGITDESSNPLTDTVPTTGTDETYTISTVPVDTTAPTVSSIERHNPTPESTDSQTLIYEVKFSEDVTGVDVTDFALSPGSTGGTGSGQFAQTRSPALAITQASTISDTITVPDSGTATSVSVAIDISHTWIGDLKVDLVAPDGTTQTLHDRSGGDADDIDQTYAPDFAGVPIAGTWTLRINDNYAAADDGTLNSWTLTINHGAGTASPVTAVSGSGDTYQVTVSATTDGTYNLDLVSSGHGITDESSNPLADTVPTTGTDETYTVSTTPADTTAPTVSSIERYSPADQNTDSQTLVYQVTFSENVTGVDSADFALSPDSTGAGSMAGLTGSGDTYRVTVSAAQDGTYNLDLVSSGHGITDESSNPLADTVPTTGTDETYTVSTTPADTTPPTVSSIERFSPTSQNTTSQTLAYRVTFSENVTGVDAADFSLSSDSTGGGTSTSGQFAQTRSPALAITEDNTVSDTITVPDSGTATSVSVAIDISHTWIGDLKVDLVAPDGTTQTLHDRSGGDADDIDQTYAPDFAGVPIAGTWTLRINDNYAAADDGTLNSWTLTINHGAGTASPVTAVSGSGDTYQVTVSATTDGTYNLDLVSSGHGITDESSNPLTDTVPTTGTDETYTISTVPVDTTAPTVSSIERHNPTPESTDSQTLVYQVTFSENVTGVDSADFALSPGSTGGTGSGQFAQTRSPALAITQASTISDTITVPDSGTATSVSVAIDISHTYIGDLKVDLIAPDGTAKTLHNRAGGTTDDIDQTYAPDFAGVPIAGTWTLRINDNYAAADDGTLNSWTLTINHGAGTASPVTAVSGSGDTYQVTVSATTDGTYNLDLVSSGHGITDESSNPLADTVPTTGTDETYTVSTTPADTTAPTVSSIERYSPADQNTDSQTLVYQVTFSENVTGVDSADFALSPDSTGGGSAHGRFAQTSEPAIPITDHSTIQDAITVDQSGTATSVSVAVDITHTYIGDLVVDLIAPDGTAQTLHNRAGGTTDDIDRTYTPDFDGIGITGDWILRVSDRAGGDTGTLNSWTLTIDHGGADSPVTGLTGSGSQYLVNVYAAQNGTYNLDIVPNNGITDIAGNPLDGTGPTGGDQPYTVRTSAIQSATNTPPSINAGPDQTVQGGQVVSLTGTATDVDSDPLTYSWSHDSALAIEFANSTAPSTTFTAPQVSSNTTFILTLTVDDGTQTASGSLSITIVETPESPRDIGEITLASTGPGVIEAGWEAPTETPADYRIAWAKAGEPYLTWTDLSGNAFPTSPSQTVTDLEEGEQYKVKVRARYGDTNPGDWSGEVTITVAGS